MVAAPIQLLFPYLYPCHPSTLIGSPSTVYPKDANANPAAVIVDTDGTLWNQALVDTDGAQKTRLEPASKAT